MSVASLELMAAESGLVVEQDLDADLPLIRGDSVKLRQVFTNLIGNAIKFTRAGGSVCIRAMRQTDGGALVEIVDSGMGMSEEEIKIALTPFGQVDGGRARLREGTGLGLPIAKSLVELHSGRLSIVSQKNTGTTVTVMLPSRHAVTAVNCSDLEVPASPRSQQPVAAL